MIKILRPARKAELVSADVFDKLFIKHLGNVFNIHVVPIIPWCDSILGPVDNPCSFNEACRNFLRETGEFDFFCPGYECISISPLFLALRNASKSNVRLLFIAHAPGAYAMQWTLFRHLLVPGDLIIAPSKSARAVIEFLCPELTPFIKVINHPLNFLPPVSFQVSAPSARTCSGRACSTKAKQALPLQPTQKKKNFPHNPVRDNVDRIVTISRIHETKLIHRQIDAMALLLERGYSNVRMDIAGPLTEPQSKELSLYARSIKARINRLHLEKYVKLVGTVYGDENKSKFLSGAKMLVYLSVSPEEAFPKSAVEALGLGIPVAATRWNGFIETVGRAGNLIPVCENESGILDVRAEDIASAIEDLLQNPTPCEVCFEQAKNFAPAPAGEKYQDALKEALNRYPSGEMAKTGSDCDIPFSSEGLLGKAAILKVFSFMELLDYHREYSNKIRRSWQGEKVSEVSKGEKLQDFLFLSTKKAVGYFLAGIDCSKWINTEGTDSKTIKRERDFAERISDSVYSNSTQVSKEMCLFLLNGEARVDLIGQRLEYLKKRSASSNAIDYLEVELELLKDNYSKAYELFNNKNEISSVRENDAVRIRQIARICRQWKKPELALPWLREWLKKYPDSPGSGMVWLDRAVNTCYSGKGFLSESMESLTEAKNLLGDVPVVRKLENNIRG